MGLEYRFLTISDLKHYSHDLKSDPERILQSGMDLYGNSILDNPYSSGDGDKAVCIALQDGKIVGRFILLQSVLNVAGLCVPIQTGGGILVSEQKRGLGIGSSMIRRVLNNKIYFGALYTRAAYDIVRKTETMLEIPQFVRYRYHGIKKVLDLPILFRQIILNKRFQIKKLTIVPEWAGDMATRKTHKYMEMHNTAWLQWALDHVATGGESDYQSFYAVYDKKNIPVGFFMTKVRHITNDGKPMIKANLIEWASADLNRLSEVDINILALKTYDEKVSRFWTISENVETGKNLKCYFFKRRGWFAMSVTKDSQYKDIGEVRLWRIRYGCCNTALVE